VNELTTRDFTAAEEPFSLFDQWMTEATLSEPNDPNAMALATVDGVGMPDVRMVLLKGVTPSGFVFYTNIESAKGRELETTAKAALVFHWKSLRRQVRIRGPVVAASDAESDAYFRSRARASQIGSWASQQSRPLAARSVLEQKFADYAARFGEEEVPRPPYWRGYRVRPLSIEFWQDQPSRLHDRVAFTRQRLDGSWTKERLYP
jgi:pyridoxamine 5'-phosphate oxidase